MSFSRVMRLSSGDWTETSISSPSSVRSEEAEVLVRAEATAIYTCATVTPFSMAALRSTEMWRAVVASSRPSDTSPVPSTVFRAAASTLAEDWRSSMSSP